MTQKRGDKSRPLWECERGVGTAPDTPGMPSQEVWSQEGLGTGSSLCFRRLECREIGLRSNHFHPEAAE